MEEGMAAMNAQKLRFKKQLADKEAAIGKLRKDVEERDDTIDKGRDMLASKTEQADQLKETIKMGTRLYNLDKDGYEDKIAELIEALKRLREDARAKQQKLER